MKRGSWALLHREMIRDLEGQEYLGRLRIIMTPWFSVYLHRIHKPDTDRWPHDHPWAFASLILRGGYVEEISAAVPGRPFIDQHVPRVRLVGSMKSVPRTMAHKIVYVMPNTVTLVFTGPRTEGDNAWGFWPDGATEHIPWREYLRSIGHPQAEER